MAASAFDRLTMMRFSTTAKLISLIGAILLVAPLHAAEIPNAVRSEAALAPTGKITIGRAEYVGIPALGDRFKARIDTGATTTSIFAAEIEEFQQDGKPWVRFLVRNPETKKDYRLEMRVSRIAAIRKRGAEGTTRRPAVALVLTIGEISKQVDVNLADRTGFKFPLLIGRDFLNGTAVVDVSLEYTQSSPSVLNLKKGVEN